MSDLRNEAEKTVTELLQMALNELTIEKTLSRVNFHDAMDYLRDALRLLGNRSYGCHSGKHTGKTPYCDCSAGVEVPFLRNTR